MNLKLTEKQLVEIGFKKKVYPGNGYIKTKSITYEIKFINGYFYYYYNINDKQHRWYQKTVIGKATKFTSLSLKNLSDLFSLLDYFQVSYKRISVLSEIKNLMKNLIESIC